MAVPRRNDHRPLSRTWRSWASRLKSINRRAAILTLCVLCSLVLHVWPGPAGFGEPDAARLAVLALEWHETGDMVSHFYQVRTSPLYIHGIKLALDRGFPRQNVPITLNWLNVLVGALAIIPLFYIFRRLSDTSTAAIACVLINVTPAFYISTLYGMPHLPAYGLFVTSLLFYLKALPPRARRPLPYAAALVLGVLAVTIKADIILCYGAFLAAAWLQRSIRRDSVAVALAIPVLALAVTVLYARAIMPESSGLTGAANEWDRSFPFTIEAVTDSTNRAILIDTAGRVLAAAAVVSIGYLLVARARLRELAFALVWALPAILFWGLKMGNSGRHMMSSYTVLMFVVALALALAVRRPLWRWCAVAVLLVANYFSGSQRPSSRVFELGESVRNYGYYRHLIGHIYAEFNMPRKVYVGTSTNPYIVWESLSQSRRFEIVSHAPVTYRTRARQRTTIFQIIETEPGSAVGPAREWFVWSFEKDVTALNFPEFQEAKDRLTAIYDRYFPKDERVDELK